MLVLALIISLVAYIVVLIAKRLKQAEQQKQLELERLADIERRKYIDPEYIEKLTEINQFNKFISKFWNYITWKERDNLKQQYSESGRFFRGKTSYYSKEDEVKKFNNVFQNFDTWTESFNKNFIESQKEKLSSFFDNIEGKKLDDQQRNAIVTDEYSNLIVAGAGSGKTLTILGKIKYLVEDRGVNPEKILLLSFTNKTVGELNERLAGLGIKLEALTFHKLGYQLVRQLLDKTPSVANENTLKKVVSQYLKEDIHNEKKALEAFIQFIACYFTIPVDENDIGSLGEKIDLTKGMDFETLKSKFESGKLGKNKKLDTFRGERVKSDAELIIANYLFLNGVEYEYEKQYSHPVYNESGYKISYNPDFYLPDYDIWLEHFGVNKNGEALWLPPFEREQYVKHMDMKIREHEKNDTKLIVTKSAHLHDNTLLEKLERELRQFNVELHPQSTEEVYEKIVIYDENFGKELRTLVETFINLAKSNRYTRDDLIEMFANIDEVSEFMRVRQDLFLDFILPAFQIYDNVLTEKNEIDFNDMINQATDLIGKNPSGVEKYDYIIVDEYQDISVARFGLIEKIRDISSARLISVGDDWQSIYRFAGSDISLFSSYGDFVDGEYEELFIERTYRNSQELIDISKRFIEQNTLQIKKEPKSDKTIEVPIEFTRYENASAVSTIIDTLLKIIKKGGADQKILILGRHSFDIDTYLEDGRVELDKETGKITVEELGVSIDIEFLTVHKAKGIEADNVIVLNLQNNLYGFPNKLTDDPLLSLLLSQGEKDLTFYDNKDKPLFFPEERRLLYVALTRTKNKVYLMVPDNESLFINEIAEYAGYLLSDTGDEYVFVNCPYCITGKLLIRENRQTREKFLGCSHYPQCNQSYRDIEILNKPTLCPSCESGFLVERSGIHGKFLGCTNYPRCKNTVHIHK